MSRIRITIADTVDRGEDLDIAAMLRLGISSSMQARPEADKPLRGTHRDLNGRAYFECAVGSTAEVEQAIRLHGFEGQVWIDEHPGKLGHECQNCGNVAGEFRPAVCPNCDFRDIDNCPNCEESVSREEYVRLSGDLFRCPRCEALVRLRFNEPVFEPTGGFRSPLILVEKARR